MPILKLKLEGFVLTLSSINKMYKVRYIQKHLKAISQDIL